MNKILKRLIVFFISLPVLFSVVIFLPQKNHLLFNAIVVLFTVIAAVEFRSILSNKNLEISLPEAAILGAVGPAVWTLVVSFGFGEEIVHGAFILVASWLLVSQIFVPEKKLDSSVNRIAAGFAVMLYPGLLVSSLIRLSLFRNSGIIILFFLLIVFLNDSLAWTAGMLFGKNNRGLLAVSPNKSIAGFAGGQLFSVLTGIVAAVLFPEIFSPKILPPITAGALLGFGSGIAVILGDLCESAIKRSAGVKDSGFLVLGRGGALDSIDSLAMAAPVYYYLFRLLFQL